MMTIVGYVVLPPGHGKSYMHGKIDGVYEADTLINCKATETLRQLRKQAKMTDEWTDYDSAWTSLIKEVLPDDTQVILVPDDRVGVKFCQSCIFRGVLTQTAWEENLRNRKGSTVEYNRWWTNVKDAGAVTYESNLELENALRSAISRALHSQ